MRSILVNADRKPGNDARIDTALDLARQFGAHVSVLVDTPVTRYIAMDPMGGSYVISDALEEARGEDDAAASAGSRPARRHASADADSPRLHRLGRR